MIDGKPVNELDDFVLKQNYYWAMGDNRDDSLDSRYWGFVPENNILGEALFAYFYNIFCQMVDPPRLF